MVHAVFSHQESFCRHVQTTTKKDPKRARDSFQKLARQYAKNLAMTTTTSSSTHNKKKPSSSSSSPSPHVPKTLASLFRHFVGIPLTVELKTGRLYHGILFESDDVGNLTLEEAHETRSIGGRRSDEHQTGSCLSTASTTTTVTTTARFASLHIRGPTIRYIHFPPDADLSVLIRKGMDRERTAAQTYARGKRRGNNSTQPSST